MVGKIDIDENLHALRILQRLDQMKQDQRQCDFIVRVDGVEFHTHRNILSAGSDYFNAMLTHDTKESQLGKVEMMGVDPQCVRICIDFIYNGKADIPDGKILDLMHASHLMQLDELFGGIVTLLEKGLNVDTFYETKELAEFYGLKNLLAKCKKFTDDNFRLISSQPDFLNQPKDFVFNAISSKNVSATEEEKLIVSLKWIRQNNERVQYFPDFVRTIKLEGVSLSYRRHLLEKESLITEKPRLFQLFYASITDSVEIQRRNKEESSDKKVVVIFDLEVDCLYYFNIHTEEMEKFHDGFVDRFWTFSAAFLHPYIYVLLDNKSVHRLSIVDERANWEKMENMTKHHGSSPPVISHDGSLYVMGGGFNCSTAASEQYLPDENKWVKLKDLPWAIECAAVVSLDEYIYIAGGDSDGRCLDSFSRFSPSKAEWTHLPPMLKAKFFCVATAANSKIYIMGGYDRERHFAEVDCFDLMTSQWMSLAPMIDSKWFFQAFCISNFIYVFGGMDANDEYVNSIEKYDMERNSWTEVKIQGHVPKISYAVLP